EVIVYDDGSTDESRSILREYGASIRLIEGEHVAGRPSRECQSNAVFQAFTRSSGEWLFLLDGDDCFVPTKVEQVLQTVNSRSGVSLVQSPVTLIDDHGIEIGRYRDRRFHHPNIRAAIREQNDVDFFYPTSAMVVHRPALEKVLPLDMSVCPELACDTRIGMLMPLLGEVITLDEPLALWRRHSGSYIAELGRSRWFQAQQTMRRVRTFNAHADRYAAPRISLWRNRRFRRQLAGALLPAVVRGRLRKTGTIFLGESKPASARG
ncbi:MAG TPA: glycosyltransferase, partial [Opitutus sp.]|nr:glycosyltransferase [Opitutus sp.]